MRTGVIFRSGSLLAVGAAIVAGALVLGSPTEERARRLDDRRVGDLRGIMAATDLYWTRHSALPGSLAELAAEPGVAITGVDPATTEPYGYQTRDSARYELCARFDRDSRGVPGSPIEALFVHGSGRQCFDLEAKEVERNGR